MPSNERDNTLSWSAQPPLVASWRAKSLPLPSCNRHTSGSFYLPAASAPGSFDIPASPSLDTLVVREASTTSRRHPPRPPAHSHRHPPRPPAQKKHKHILRALRAHFLLIDPDSTGLVQSTLVPRCLVAAGLHLPPGPLAEAASVVGRPGRMCDWRALLRWLKAHPEHISSSLTSAPALVHPKVPAGGRTGSAEAADAGVEAAEKRASASGLPSSSSAPTLPRVVPHRATAAELKARVTLPFTSPAALQWAASGAFGVGGQPGAAVAAAAAAVRRVGGANPAQSFPKLPRSGGGTPAASARLPPARKPRRPEHVHYWGESFRSVSPRSSFARSLPSLDEFLPEQARRGPRSIFTLLGLTLHLSLCLCLSLNSQTSLPPSPPPSPPLLLPSPSQRSQPRPLPCPARPTRVALATTWQRRAQGCNPVYCIPNTTHPGAFHGRDLRRDQGGAAQSTVRPPLPSWALRLAMAPARAVLASSQGAAALIRQGPWRRAGQRSTRRSAVSLASTRRPRALRRVRFSSASRSHPGISVSSQQGPFQGRHVREDVA